MLEGVYRRCSECGGEFQAWVARCLDCDVPLGDYVDSAEPISVHPTEPPEEFRTGSVDIADLGERNRERLRSIMVGSGHRFEMNDQQLWFRESARDLVESILEDLGSGSSATARPGGRRVQGGGPGTRSDRRTKEPSGHDPRVAADGRAAVELAEFLGHRSSGRSSLSAVISYVRTSVRAKLRRRKHD